jgi:sensor histidine kinase YesM
LYLLANFSRILRDKFRNELLRKNIVAWLIIFCISVAMLPMGGGFFFLLERYGWGWAIGGQLISTTLCTLIIFNVTRLVAESPRLKKLSFVTHKILVSLTLIGLTLAINIPLSFALYGAQNQYLKYVIVNSVYIAGATALVYTVMSYLDIETKRKFHQKELELSRLRELKTKAELDALHSKINPHFLYNALNSIADLSVTDGKKARQMTIALADLFRYSINYSNNNYSTVKDEVEMANVYLQIEKIRFEDKLNYSLYIEEGLDHFLVPRFVLQPLVENAVKHGLKATGKMTEINLQVKRAGNGLVLHVADSGPAFPEQLDPGYGVKSVYDKLDLLFPDAYEIHYTNEPIKQVSLYINKMVKDESAV